MSWLNLNEINPNLIYSKYEQLFGYEGIKASLLFNKRTNLELFWSIFVNKKSKKAFHPIENKFKWLYDNPNILGQLDLYLVAV